MDADLLRLLLELDARYADQVEAPEEMDWRAMEVRVEALRPLIERLTGHVFELSLPEAASFYGDLTSQYRREDGNEILTLLGVRFSNFGELFTVWSIGARELPADVVAKVIEVTRDHGFVYVDYEALRAPYTGVVERFKDLKVVAVSNWFTRFFDHVRGTG